MQTRVDGMTAEIITPFTISIEQSELDDLLARLRATRFAPDLPAEGWSKGVPGAYLRELVTYWAEQYDWRAQERRLNEFPQFTTVIDDQQIHFVHVESAVPGALPLLLTHGWPGSFVEFLDIVGPLTDPEAFGGDPRDAFSVVIPSLPGFAFSSPLVGEGWTTNRIARTWAELMRRLGYERYAVQGGDIGASVSPEVARVDGDHMVGVHVNGGLGLPPGQLNDDELAELTDLERDRMRRIGVFMQEEYGYIAIQSTRPATLGAALVDSPVGQLAWIVDKFREWTFPLEANPDVVIGRDRLLTNVMLYWLTRTAASAAYVGYAQGGNWGQVAENSGVPTASIDFAHDVGIRRFAEQENNIVRWTNVEGRGGHFAALEEPALLVGDIREFLRDLR
jgi:pimeloyl-ACP methyl ester carboxylesterase